MWVLDPATLHDNRQALFNLFSWVTAKCGCTGTSETKTLHLNISELQIDVNTRGFTGHSETNAFPIRKKKYLAPIEVHLLQL